VDARRDAALLVLSEVVTNVVRHTSSKRFTVRVDLSDGVEVAVHDSDPTMPKVRAAQSSDESGRGMVMVQALADDWGVHAVTGGKWVWFRLSRDFPAAA